MSVSLSYIYHPKRQPGLLSFKINKRSCQLGSGWVSEHMLADTKPGTGKVIALKRLIQEDFHDHKEWLVRIRMRLLAFLSMRTSSPTPEKKSTVLVTYEILVRVKECETLDSNIFKLWPNTSVHTSMYYELSEFCFLYKKK